MKQDRTPQTTITDAVVACLMVTPLGKCHAQSEWWIASRLSCLAPSEVKNGLATLADEGVVEVTRVGRRRFYYIPSGGIP